MSRALLRQARRFAATGATVLLTGETGVGKNVFARYLHTSGPRRREPFVTIDCPALPLTLIEAELFGHERGAFTDAGSARPGRFELAGSGTVYLDTVTGLALSGQGALLRVLEERLATRLGGTRPIEIRARIVASAAPDIEDRAADGRFRPELFHRLRVLPLHIPPLRERPDDIPPLARAFLRDFCRALKRPLAVLTRETEDALVRYHWPGNVRELRHVLERMLFSNAADVIHAIDLPDYVLDVDHACPTGPDSQPPTLDEVERRYITATLHRTRGNQTRAAAILGISRKALWEKRKRFGLA